MKKILITGGDGQLGLCIHAVEKEYGAGNEFYYLTASQFDVTNKSQMENVIADVQPTHIVNCAAYTAVDKAESESELAYAVNAKGPGVIARLCKTNNITLIHISTDFVFEGDVPEPIKEDIEAHPIGVYGETKFRGEQLIIQEGEKYFIVRTSWLYSEFQNNFLKTMVRLGNERDELSVVYDQIGTPTYARDLAKVIFTILNSGSHAYGVYHYSNEGVTSWYDFANEIFKIGKIQVSLRPISSSQYPTPAKRPSYSVMSKDKIKKEFNLNINHWSASLELCMQNL